MITQYGMSEKFGLIGLESIQNRYLTDVRSATVDSRQHPRLMKKS